MKSGSDRIGSGHYTDSAPAYSLFSRQATVSIGIATALIVGTLALMWGVRGTALATGTIWLYQDAPLAPYTGILVFGAILTGCRLLGLEAAANDAIVTALFASLVVAVAYAAFGAGILSLYEQAIHGTAILITAGITAGLTVGAAVLVQTTNHSFANWDKYSGLLMIGGVLIMVPGSLTGLQLFFVAGFGLILLGWLVDLVFEIYMVSDHRRSPMANGIGVYIAFMGVFVHILQLVLEAMAQGE